jgi:C_GCAxxG_C_C family probable redox protein
MEKEKVIDLVKEKAEGYFDRGEFFCSESVVHTINEFLGWPFPQSITKMASGFPIGMGKSGCLCGAVSGGQMALGMGWGRNHGEQMHADMFPVAAKLHDYIKQEYRSTCCRVIVKDYEFASPERKKHCVQITGEVAAWVANELIEAGQVNLEDIKL